MKKEVDRLYMCDLGHASLVVVRQVIGHPKGLRLVADVYFGELGMRTFDINDSDRLYKECHKLGVYYLALQVKRDSIGTEECVTGNPLAINAYGSMFYSRWHPAGYGSYKISERQVKGLVCRARFWRANSCH